MSGVTHDELIEHAAKWLQTKNCVVVITDMTHKHPETPDAIGWNQNRSILIEVKVSRADFLRDKKKGFRKNPALGMGDERLFLVPEGLVKTEELPEGWGLLEYRKPKGRQRKPRVVAVKGGGSWAPTQRHKPNLRAEQSLLISALRRTAQNCPKGISVRVYTFETQNRATLGVKPSEEQ